jgi:hypothetical protein
MSAYRKTCLHLKGRVSTFREIGGDANQKYATVKITNWTWTVVGGQFGFEPRYHLVPRQCDRPCPLVLLTNPIGYTTSDHSNVR